MPGVTSQYYHISNLAEIIYFYGISKNQRRKFSSFHSDTSVRRIRLFLIGQRSMWSSKMLFLIDKHNVFMYAPYIQ